MTNADIPSRRREGWLALLLFLALGVVQLSGALRDFDHLGAKDWNAFLGQAQADLTTLRDYGQLPRWNPWRAGGQVGLAQPESMWLSPVTPLALAVGVVPAFKLLLVPTFVLGCLGTWALAGHLGLAGLARVVPALVLFGSSIFPLYVAGGLPNWLFGLALLPWLFLFHRRAIEDHRFVFATALAYAGLLFCGSIWHFVFVPVVLGLDALLVSLSRRDARAIASLGCALLVGLGLAAIRVVPLLEVYAQFPRDLPGTGRHLTPALIVRALLSSDLPDLAHRQAPFVATGAYWINFGSYVGPVAVGLAAVGAALRPRATWGLTALGATFLWLTLGSEARLPLWSALHQLPVFGSMQGPARLIVFVTFVLALLAGHGFAVLQQVAAARRVSLRARRALALALLLALALPMLLVNAPISRSAFLVEPPWNTPAGGWLSVRTTRPPFRQKLVGEHPLQFGGELYRAVLRNEGSALGQSDIPVGTAVRPQGHRLYRGEVFLQDGHGGVAAEITPNAIHVRADVTAPDRLVVNQNYFPGWRAEGTLDAPLVPLPQENPDLARRVFRAGERSTRGAVLSLPLPPGRHELTLRYHAPGLAVGFAVSVLAAAAALTYLAAARLASAPRPHRFGAREAIALTVHAVLAATMAVSLL